MNEPHKSLCKGRYNFRTLECAEVGPKTWRWFPVVESWDQLSDKQKLITTKEQWQEHKPIRNDLFVAADREGLLYLSRWFKNLADKTIIGAELEPSHGDVYESPKLVVELIEEFYVPMEDLEDY